MLQMYVMVPLDFEPVSASAGEGLVVVVLVGLQLPEPDVAHPQHRHAPRSPQGGALTHSLTHLLPKRAAALPSLLAHGTNAFLSPHLRLLSCLTLWAMDACMNAYLLYMPWVTCLHGCQHVKQTC